MAEHQVRGRNNVIYIIPNDDLYQKYQNGELIIDTYGRLVDSKTKRVIKELKHYSERPPVSHYVPTKPNSPSIMDHLKTTARDRTIEFGEELIDHATDKFFYEILPNAWHNHVVPFLHNAKHELFSKELKAETVISNKKADLATTVRQKSKSHMTQEEVYAEKQKIVYNWVEILISLRKLNDAGEVDIDSAMSQLMDPNLLQQVNLLLDENPNLLETKNYLTLRDMLGRDLYKNDRFIPVRVEEISAIASLYGYKRHSENESSQA